MAIFSNKADILGFDDMRTVDVPVPEWTREGEDVAVVRIRTLSGSERDKFETDMIDQRKGVGNNKLNFANLRARLVVLCAVDENGKRLFEDKDVTPLGRKSSMAINRLFEAAQKLNGMSDADVKEMVEDFENDPNESSTSG